MAACLVFISLIGYFIISNNNQKKNISELNALVQQLEQKSREDNNNIITPAVVINDVKEKQPESIITGQKNDPPRPHRIAPTVQLSADASTPPMEGIGGYTSSAEKPVSEKPKGISVPVHENLFKLVSVKSNKYKTGVLGGISNLQLEITNNSLVELHKVAIEIRYLGPEKKVVRTQTVFFENVQPGAQTTIDVPKSNRGVTVDYTITDIKS
jgi:hypothetical protein